MYIEPKYDGIFFAVLELRENLNQMTSIDWDLTLDTILSGKCILFLGPEVFTTADGSTLNQRLLKYINATDDPGVKVYEDGLFFFQMKQKRTETYLKIRRFFQEEQFPEAEALFEKIARIPFHFIITATPDILLAQAYDQLQLKSKSDFYWKKQPADHSMPVPTRQQPLLYAMLGSIEKPESLVLTHDDLFDYLESIFQAQSMSDQLKDHIINEAQSIVFLGIPFDRWYMQLLLRVLHLHKDEEFMRFAVSQELGSDLKTLCKDQFEINFVPRKIEGFVEEIYQRCEARGALRRVGTPQQSFIEVLTELLINDELEEAMQRFRSWLEEIGERGRDLLDDVSLVTSRFRRLMRKVNQGILSQEEAALATNKIRASLLELIKEAKAFE